MLFRSLLWDRRYDARDRENVRAIAALPDGGLALVGDSTGKARWSTDIWVLRTDANGTPLWSRNYGTRAQDKASAARPDGHGDIVVLGMTYCEAPGLAWLLRYPAALPRTAPAGRPAGLGIPRGCVENGFDSRDIVFEDGGMRDHQRRIIGFSVDRLKIVELVGPSRDLSRTTFLIPASYRDPMAALRARYLVSLATPASSDVRDWAILTVPRLREMGGEAMRVSDGRIITMHYDPIKLRISLTVKAMR